MISEHFFFSEGVARVPVSLWGFGGEAMFAKSCVMLATVRNRLRVRRKALLMRECSWSGLENVSSSLVATQAFAEEVSA